jgi:hypothetical protein
MSKVLVAVKRESVCMGDDINTPHAISFKMSDDNSLMDLFTLLARRNYLVQVAGKNHSWSCLVDGKRLATIKGNNRLPESTEHGDIKLSGFVKGGVINVSFEYHSSAT